MDKSKGSKLRSYPGVDRISQLPDSIIDNILVRLPIEDAARTAVLSRKWNHAWFSISKLKFDQSFAAKSKRVGYPIMAIYGILMLHLGPIIKFKLLIDRPDRGSAIDRVFHTLSRKSVQKLDFSIRLTTTRYRLPSHFYSCLQLRSLKISNCTMNPPCNFIGFRNLSHVKLQDLDLTSNMFENFISKCPLLEELNLLHCNFTDSSVIKINASNLKRLNLNGVGSCFRFIYVPLLKSLRYIGSKGDQWYVRGPDYEGLEKSSLDQFCNALPSLESLTVDYFFLQILVVLNMSSTYGRRLKWLHSLKLLVATDVHLCNIDEFTSLLGLLGSSPNLERLIIEMDYAYNTAGKGNPFLSLEPNHLDFSCKKLQVVSLTEIAGHDSEIELVKLLLLKSPGLKTMCIRVKDHVKTNTQLKILTKVTRFRRASAAAEIEFFGSED